MKKQNKTMEEAITELKDGKELNNLVSQLYKKGVETLLEGELDGHLGYKKHGKRLEVTDNYRNGKTQKQVKTPLGAMPIEVPRDREGTFNSELLPKRKRVIEVIEDAIITLYARGMTTRDIAEQIKDIYGVQMSDSSVSRITDRIIEEAKNWQLRPLEKVYLLVWLDGLVVRVRKDNRVIHKTLYVAIGISLEGRKEVLGMWISETETSTFWMQVLDEIKQRGVEDILVTATDNLKGLTQAITALFPKTVTQICMAHQIRNSLRYVAWKDRAGFATDLKKIYQAFNRKLAEQALEELKQKWNRKYPMVVRSWENNWENLSAFYDFPKDIRRIMYTTNVIENFNRVVRKFTKNKLIFPNDDAVMKIVYLTVVHLSKLWSQPSQDWQSIINQFTILYPDRLKLKI